jgi:hypothetical protein
MEEASVMSKVSHNPPGETTNVISPAFRRVWVRLLPPESSVILQFLVCTHGAFHDGIIEMVSHANPYEHGRAVTEDLYGEKIASL